MWYNADMKANNAYCMRGVSVPAIGFGTYLIPKEKTEDCVLRALGCGYRHIDTAAFYGNERETGNAVRRSGLKREDVFVTSKVWASDRGYEKTLAAFDRTMNELGFDYLDMYLIHWPESPSRTPDWEKVNLATWQAMTELYKAGRVKAIGVSNFLPRHLDALMRTEIPPMADQIEYNIGTRQPETVNYCREHGVLVEAWSPLGRGRLLADERLTAIAAKRGITTAQLCIAWCASQGVLPLPKTTDTARMRENLAALSVRLSDEDIAAIGAIPPFGASGRDPDANGF